MNRIIRPLRSTLRNFLPLKPYFVQNRLALGVGLLSLLAVDFLQLLIPMVIKRAVDLLTTQSGTGRILLHHALVIAGIALIMALLRYVWRHLIFGHARAIEKGLRNRFYEHLQTLSLSFFYRTKTGDLMARAVNDINAVRMATGMGLVALTDAVVLGLSAIGFMLSINVKLTLLSLFPAPIVVLLIKVLTRRMSTGFETVQRTFSDLTERVREAFSGIRVVKAYGQEVWQTQRVRQQGEEYVKVNMDLAKTLAFFMPMMTVFTNVGLALVLWFGGRLTIVGDISAGDFVAFISYLNLLAWPMMAMGWVTNLIQRGSASMRRIRLILEEVPEIKNPAQPIPMPMVKGEIEIRGLTFVYPGAKTPVLNDISLRIEAGETVAVVGQVGCGKTTLMQILPRLWDAPVGTVFVDGCDITRLPLGVLRENMGVVTQEVFLFSDTIRNNVLFGMEKVSEEDLEKALRIAGLFDEIQGLDHGLDARLGERGITLSGGQRQRLTIARTLIRNPPILILDDALSMVDTHTEEVILNQILALRSLRTNLIVSHRVSTLSRAHRILVLDEGRICEQGTHEGLMRRGGIYARIYEEQQLMMDLEERIR